MTVFRIPFSHHLKLIQTYTVYTRILISLVLFKHVLARAFSSLSSRGSPAASVLKVSCSPTPHAEVEGNDHSNW